MVLIQLTQGKEAVIDEADLSLVAGFKWCAVRIHGCWYAKTMVRGHCVYMHRVLVTGVPEVDHLNGDGLDNRRCNLRAVTHAQNLANQRPQVGRSSKFKGVSWYRSRGRWEAYIKVNGNQKRLGYFNDEDEAARAYDKAALAAWGEHARLNFGSA